MQHMCSAAKRDSMLKRFIENVAHSFQDVDWCRSRLEYLGYEIPSAALWFSIQ